MDRNYFFRAMKLYLKAAANPFVIALTILFSGMMLAVFIIDPDPVGSKDYMSMLSAIQMGKLGFFFIVMMGNLKLQQNKFYASCCCGKELYTAAPIVTVLAVSLIYDVILAAIAAVNLGSTGLSDVLIMDSIGSALLISVAACYGKKKLSFGSVIPYFLFISIPGVIGKLGILDGIFGLSVGLSVVIAVSVYVVSVVLSLIVVNTWWKKSDRFAMPNKFIANSMIGQ
ncbi:MAG: hypothetical protein K2H89_10850 [Oscillospiraceae bacterium]|nr:hypothetical protein [Oscillospiraceae bacterium]